MSRMLQSLCLQPGSRSGVKHLATYSIKGPGLLVASIAISPVAFDSASVIVHIKLSMLFASTKISKVHWVGAISTKVPVSQASEGSGLHQLSASPASYGYTQNLTTAHIPQDLIIGKRLPQGLQA